MSFKKVSCPNCGASLIFDPSTQKNICNFCGSAFDVEKAENTELMEPDYIIPFSTTKEEILKPLFEWLIEGKYVPDDILDDITPENLMVTGVYLPVYLYKGHYDSNWSASSGYRMVIKTKTRDLGKSIYYSLVPEADPNREEIIEWRPSSGQASGDFAVLCFAGLLKGVENEVANNFVSNFYFSDKLKKFSEKYTAGFSLLEFSYDADKIWSNQGDAKVKKIIESDISHRIPGDTFKDLSYDISYSNISTYRVYLPVWIVYYKYKKNLFLTFIDGTNVSRIDGIKPEDKFKKERVKKFYKPAAVGCVVTLISFITGIIAVGWYALLGTIVLLIIGKIREVVF